MLSTIPRTILRTRPTILTTKPSLLIPAFRGFASTTPFKMPSISESIIDDHRELDEYYEKILDASDNDTKTRYANLLTWELARHAIGEELIMYPAMEKHIPDGKKLADHDREEHANVCAPSSNYTLLVDSFTGKRTPLQIPRLKTRRCRVRTDIETFNEGFETP